MGTCESRDRKPPKSITKRHARLIKPQDLPQLQQIHVKHKSLSENDMHQLLSEYFDSFDTDGDGILSFREIQIMLRQMERNINKKRNKKIAISNYEIRALFSRIDVSGDMKVSKEEFYRFYKS